MRQKNPAKSSPPLHPHLAAWLKARKLKPFPFQLETWQRIGQGRSGLLNAPTGSGKTYAVLLGLFNKMLHEGLEEKHGLHILWVTPLRALAKDFYGTVQDALEGLMPAWKAGLRSGDTAAKDRAAQKKAMPQFLITTPESLHLLISQKGHEGIFKNLHAVVVDEWHELLGTKRGTQLELGLAHIHRLNKNPLPRGEGAGGGASSTSVNRSMRKSEETPTVLPFYCFTFPQVWGISATIGNMLEGAQVLLGPGATEADVVRTDIEKEYAVQSVVPEHVDDFPWAGHLGLNMVEHVVPLVEAAKSCLLFTNTRAQAELWYQALLSRMPDLAGQSALHHGSLEGEIRTWVEDALRQGKAKLVVCTSSLDLGVDFAPVDRVIQIGSPKGIARLMQRAGRSGHRPGAVSRIFLVPTHALEIIEFEALKTGLEHRDIESRSPIHAPLDVLLQYMMTLAIGDGFTRAQLEEELATTWAYRNLEKEKLDWAFRFLIHGGESLSSYDEYARLEQDGDRYLVTNRRMALRHRLGMGTIVSSQSIRMRFLSGGYIGSVEETFVSALNPGDTFFFAGRALEFVMIKGMDMLVRKSTKSKGVTPRWAGGRMPLSANLSQRLRDVLIQARNHQDPANPLSRVNHLLKVQEAWSIVPSPQEFLVEFLRDRDGVHFFFYPFEGRLVHEILGALVAWRITREVEATFSIAMNDYGFELLTATELTPDEVLSIDLFSIRNLRQELELSINQTDLARKRFREVATIAGLVFTGYPGRKVQERHTRVNASLIFDVFRQYDPDNLLLQQAYDEVFNFEVEESRLVHTLERIQAQRIILKETRRPTPFAFPILTDRLREKSSNESMEKRVQRMLEQLEKAAEGV